MKGIQPKMPPTQQIIAVQIGTSKLLNLRQITSSFTSFSRSGLIDQLKYEGFTREQAEYGVKQNGY